MSSEMVDLCDHGDVQKYCLIDTKDRMPCCVETLKNTPLPSFPGDDPEDLYQPLDADTIFPSFSANTSVLMEGWLDKRGYWNPARKSRYFVLEMRGRLSYFKSEADRKLNGQVLGSIPINADVEITASKNPSSQEDRIQIEIRVPNNESRVGRTFVLSTRCREDGERWLAILQETRSRVFYVSFPKNVRHW